MKTSNKKYIVMSLVFVAICLPITFLIVFIATRSNSAEKPGEVIVPTSFPVSYTGGTDVEVDPSGEMIKYKYALITNEDFIQLKNEEKELYINLDKNNWKNIAFSDNGELIAVLGEKKNDVNDLFIYSLKTKKWTTGTQYSQQENGIQSFKWISNTVVYYVQGESNDRWIHSFNYTSGEIIKLKKVDGDMVISNSKSDNIIIDNIDRFTVYDKDLKLLAEINKTQISETGDLIVFNNLYADFGEKFYLVNDSQYYEYNISEAEDKISPKELEGFPLCQISSSQVLTFEQGSSGDTIYKNNLNLQNQKELLGNIQSAGEELVERYKCIENEIFFFINSSVYYLTDGSYNSSNILKNAKDFDIL